MKICRQRKLSWEKEVEECNRRERLKWVRKREPMKIANRRWRRRRKRSSRRRKKSKGRKTRMKSRMKNWAKEENGGGRCAGEEESGGRALGLKNGP